MEVAEHRHQPYHKAYLMVLSIGRGDIPSFQNSIENGAPVNARVAPQGLNWTPLFFAVFAGNAEMVLQLLQRGGEVNLTAARQDTPLHLAVEGQFFDVAKLLLNWGANPMAKNTAGVSPFGLILVMKSDRLSHENRLRWTRMFLDAKADPNAECRDGMNFLHQACAMGYLELAKELVCTGGADICAPESKYQYTPLMCALANLRSDIVKYIIQEYCQRLMKRHGSQALHVLLAMEAQYVKDRSEHCFVASLPIGMLKVDHLYIVCDTLIWHEPYCIRERNKEGALPLSIACQTNAPHQIIDLLLCNYPDALLFESF